MVLARWVSYVNPAFHYDIRGIHIHHYTYGIFMLAVAGYLALALKGRRATLWIALLYGWGLGFTFDEMGIWLNSSIAQSAAWDKSGVIAGTLALTVSTLISVLLKKLPPAKETEATGPATGVAEPENVRFTKGTIDLVAAQEKDS